MIQARQTKKKQWKHFPLTIRTCVRLILVLGVFFLGQSTVKAQVDSVERTSTFTGSLGFTNNGFSIIPSFSFNKPAFIALLDWRKEKFSIDPDIRVTPNGKKGSMLLWFRYHAVETKRFGLRIGAHPAVNWLPVKVGENGDYQEMVRLRRFLAWELSPTYRINRSWTVGLYYLQGNGLQKDGPQTTHFVNLNTTVSDIYLSKQLRFMLSPAVYYLYLDGTDGVYFTATAALSHVTFPFTLQSIINQTFSSNIPGNKNFMWNIGLSYIFRRKIVR